MSLRTDNRRNKLVSDIAGVESRVGTIISQVNGIFSDLVKLQNFINSKAYFTAAEKTEIQTIINETYKDIWDDCVARTPVAIKNTNRD